MSYRVVQWATGNQGVEAIRAILDRPDLDLVGAKVYSGDKDGVDAGVLAGRPACGVPATQDIDEILALGADCVAYFPGTRRSTRSAESWPVEPMSPPPPSCSTRGPAGRGPGTVGGRLRGGELVGPRHRAQSREPERSSAPGAVRHVTEHREGDPPGTGRLVVLRVDPHHLRQHAVRPAAGGGHRGRQRLPEVQQRHLPGRGGAHRRGARCRPRPDHLHRWRWSWPSRITRSSAFRYRPEPCPASAGTGRVCVPGRCWWRSRRCGRWVASTRDTGRPRLTGGP